MQSYFVINLSVTSSRGARDNLLEAGTGPFPKRSVRATDIALLFDHPTVTTSADDEPLNRRMSHEPSGCGLQLVNVTALLDIVNGKVMSFAFGETDPKINGWHCSIPNCCAAA